MPLLHVILSSPKMNSENHWTLDRTFHRPEALQVTPNEQHENIEKLSRYLLPSDNN